MGVGISCDLGEHDRCLRPSCSCSCHVLSYGRRMLLAPARTAPTSGASRSIDRDCTSCGRPFVQETRQGRPFSKCAPCRA